MLKTKLTDKLATGPVPAIISSRLQSFFASSHVMQAEETPANSTVSHPSDDPPAYSATADTPTPPIQTPTQHQHLNPLQHLSILATIPFHNLPLPSSTVSQSRTSLTTTHASYYSSAEALVSLLIKQASIPPKPILRIKGMHNELTSRNITDFDLYFDLTSLLDLISTPTGTLSHLRIREPPCPPSGGSKPSKFSSHQNELQSLQFWTREFCVAERSENKSFTLTRTILGFPAAKLELSIRKLLTDLKYLGDLEIGFPVEYSAVTVHKQPGSWLSGILKIYPEKKMEVVEAIWNMRHGEQTAVAEEWWREWEGPLRNAILRRERGVVGVEEWVQYKRGAREKALEKDWGANESSFQPKVESVK